MERLKSNNTVTIEEQRAQGLTRQTSNFVPAAPARRTAPLMPLNSQVAHVIDVAPTATQHIEMKTSAVDRSKGFLIANLPLFGAFALMVWLLSGLFTGTPLFSFLAFCILWASFVLAWLASYAYTLHVSAEGVSLFEARMKWKIIAEEQRRRWEHYEKLTGEDE